MGGTDTSESLPRAVVSRLVPSAERVAGERVYVAELAEREGLVVRHADPPSTLQVLATLSLARLIDRTPNLIADWEASRSIAIDVADPLILEELRRGWRDLLGPDTGQVLYVDKATANERRSAYFAVALVVCEPPKSRHEQSARDLLKILAGWVDTQPFLVRLPSKLWHSPRIYWISSAMYYRNTRHHIINKGC